jgi:hypothetical protein
VRESLASVLICVLTAWAAGVCGCAAAGSRGRDRSYAAMEAAERVPKVPRREVRLAEEALNESSGVAASRRNPGLFWTHNDSGDGPYLYAFDGAGGRRGVWRVTGAQADDWEDMAAGPGPEPGRAYLYVGDIGDNEHARAYLSVYRVPEPAVAPEDAGSTRRRPRATEPAAEIRLKYPDGRRHNAEALLVHPQTGDLYLIVKTGEAACGVYRLRARQASAGVNTLERVGEFRSPSPLGSLVTGGAISPDGRRVVLCDYLSAYELRLPEAPGAAFESVWEQTPAVVHLGPRKQGESVCYRLDGAALVTTSEGSPAMFYEIELRN